MYTVGDKVQYRTVAAGTVLGKVTGTSPDGTKVEVTVTSRTNRYYPQGRTIYLNTNTAFLSKRA